MSNFRVIHAKHIHPLTKLFIFSISFSKSGLLTYFLSLVYTYCILCYIKRTSEWNIECLNFDYALFIIHVYLLLSTMLLMFRVPYIRTDCDYDLLLKILVILKSLVIASLRSPTSPFTYILKKRQRLVKCYYKFSSVLLNNLHVLTIFLNNWLVKVINLSRVMFYQTILVE